MVHHPLYDTITRLLAKKDQLLIGYSLFNGQNVTTAIFKDPVKGPIMLRKLNLDGDKQADLTVHGGVDKAVHSYPVEHYDYWRKQFLTLILYGECLVRISRLKD